MGTPALTTRGLTEEDFDVVADFFDRAVQISLKVREQTGKKIKDYRAALADGGDDIPELVKLKEDVSTFARQFPTIGYEVDGMRYK